MVAKDKLLVAYFATLVTYYDSSRTNYDLPVGSKSIAVHKQFL